MHAEDTLNLKKIQKKIPEVALTTHTTSQWRLNSRHLNNLKQNETQGSGAESTNKGVN